MELELDIPFVWPDARVIKGLARYWSLSPIEHACVRANGLFGMITDLSDVGLIWFGNLCDDPEFQARIIVVLYPTCATTQEDLNALQAIQAQSGGRAQVRLHAVKHRGEPTANVTWFRTRDDAQGFLVVGAAGNFGYFSGKCVTDVNLAFRPNAILLDQVRNVFDYIWAMSSPLSDANVALPALEPAPGDPEAERLWLDFMAKCTPEEGHTEKVEVDPETGHVAIKSATVSTEPVSPTVELGTRPLSKLQRELGALYAKGALVTIEKTSRVPPIDAPVKPEWFGLESFRQTGTVTRRVSFSVSPFDEALRLRIDTLRKRPAQLLPRFTYQLV